MSLAAYSHGLAVIQPAPPLHGAHRSMTIGSAAVQHAEIKKFRLPSYLRTVAGLAVGGRGETALCYVISRRFGIEATGESRAPSPRQPSPARLYPASCDWGVGSIMSCCGDSFAEATIAFVEPRAVGRRGMLRAAAPALAAPFIPSQGNAAAKTLQLGFCSQLLCAPPYFVAQAGECFKAEGLAVEIVNLRGGPRS
jgi:hypothetical protein